MYAKAEVVIDREPDEDDLAKIIDYAEYIGVLVIASNLSREIAFYKDIEKGFELIALISMALWLHDHYGAKVVSAEVGEYDEQQ